MEKLLCGVDLGGTKLAVMLTNASGTVRDKLVVYDHITKSDREIALYITDLIKRILSKKKGSQG